MAIQSYFFNAVESNGVYDRVYSAEDVTSYLNQLVGNGVFPTPSTQLQVSASSGMNVVVKAGSGWINGHKMVNTTDMILTISQSDVLLPRIDRVIFYVDHTLRQMGISVLTGTPAAEPTYPALTRTNLRYEMCLADIRVNKQISAITAAMITDRRADSRICGYVAGLITQMDTTTMWQQWQAKFNEWMAAVQDQFVAGKAYKKLEGIHITTRANEASFNVKTYIPTYSFAYDILEVYINGIHLTGNEYTLSGNTVTLETPIQSAGAVVDFVVYKSYDPEA